MKNFSILCFLMLFVFSASFAQDTEVILEKKSANAFPLTFDNFNKKSLEFEWKKFTNLLGVKAKKNKDTKEFFVNDIIIKEISSKPLDIYATFIKSKRTSIITIWVSVDDVFINPEIHKVESAVINQLLNDFSSIAVFNEAQRKNNSTTATRRESAASIVNESNIIPVKKTSTGGCEHAKAPIEN